MFAETGDGPRAALLSDLPAEWVYWDESAFSTMSLSAADQAMAFLLKMLDGGPCELQATKQVVLRSLLDRGASFAELLSDVSVEAFICWVELTSALRRYFASGEESERLNAKNLLMKIHAIFHSAGLSSNNNASEKGLDEAWKFSTKSRISI